MGTLRTRRTEGDSRPARQESLKPSSTFARQPSSPISPAWNRSRWWSRPACRPPRRRASRATPSWTSKKAPMTVAVDGGGATCTVAQTCFKVWISTVTAYDPIDAPVGQYLIHSTGKFGNGPASRSVVVDVSVRPYPFPIGGVRRAVHRRRWSGHHAREHVHSELCGGSGVRHIRRRWVALQWRHRPG